jgi:hypothetical protein
MKKISLILVVLVVFGVTASAEEWLNFNERGESAPIYDVTNSTSSLVEFELEIPGMNRKIVNNYHRVRIPEHTRMDSIGFPEVPVITYLIAIPECDNVNLNITLLDSVVIDNINIYPAPEWIEHNNGDYSYMEEQFTINNTFYNTDTFFPGYTGELVEKGAVRAQHCIRVRIYPVQFNPVQQQIIAYSRLNIEMTFGNVIGSVNEDVGLFNEVCGNAMINYNSNGISASISSGTTREGSWDWLEPADLSGEYVNPACDYLIITHQNFYTNENAKIAIENLAIKRADYNGFDVRIVKMVDIGSYITGYNDTERMRNLIRNTYNDGHADNTWDSKIGYVLLFGDAFFGDDMLADCVPTHPYQNDPDTLGYDVYFSRLTEINDLPDIYPDVLIGRIPADEDAHIINASTKIVDFEPIVIDENYNGWKDRMLFINSDFESYANQGFEMIHPFVSNYDNTLLSFRYPNQYTPAPIVGMFQHFGYTYDPTSPHDATLESYYTAGNLIVSYMGHGGSWKLAPERPTMWWGFNHIEDDPDFEGVLPFIISSSCDTGRFQAMQRPDHLIEYECFAEKFLSYHNNKGAIAIIASSETSYAYAFHEYVPYFYEGLNSSLFLCGELNLFAKLKTPTQMYADHYNLIGDPATNIYLDTEIIDDCDLFCSPLEIEVKSVNNQNLCITAGVKNLSEVTVNNVIVKCILTDNFTNESYEELITIDLLEGMDTESAIFNFNISDFMPTEFDILIDVNPGFPIPERNEENNETEIEYSYYRYQENFPLLLPLYDNSFNIGDIPLCFDNSIIFGGKKISKDGDLCWDSGINTEGISLPVYNSSSDVTDYIMRDDETRHLYRINDNDPTNPIHYDTGIYNVYNDYCLGDINNDGVLELIVGCKYQLNNRKVMIFNLDGNLLTYEQIDNAIIDIAIGDGNNNGKIELFVLNGNANPVITIYEMNDGQLIEINQINVLDDPQNIFLEDFNNNGFLDIVTFSDNSMTFFDCSNYTSYLQIVFTNQAYSYSIGDIDNDGITEPIILLMGSNFFEIDVYKIDVLGNQFEFLSNIERPHPLYGSSLALYDLNSDNQLDLILTSYINMSNKSILGYSINGDLIFAFPDNKWKTMNIIADLDNDNDIEVIFGEEIPDNDDQNYRISVSDLDIPVSISGNIYPKMNEFNNNLYSQPVAGQLSENTDYYWNGSITLYDEVILPATSTLTIHPGTIIKAKENSKLTIYGELIVNGTENHPVIFEPIIQGASEDYWQGLEFPEGNAEVELNHVVIQNANLYSVRDMTINGGSLINTPLLQVRQSLWISNIDFDNSPITADLYGLTGLEIVSINNCHIYNSPLNPGVEITGYPNINISDNIVENCDSGIKLWESGSGIINSISNNIIRNNSQNYGIFIYHSNIDILGHNRIENNRDGLFIIRDSNFNLIGSEDYPLQIIRDNSEHEIRFTFDSRPSQLYYNKIYDENHEYSYVKCERIPLFTEPIDVSNNNWRTSFNPNTDLSPLWLFTYLPMWDPGIPRNPDTNADEEMYLSAQQSIDNEDYTGAEQTLKQIITIYPESKYATIAAKELLDLEVKSGQDFAGLKFYFENESNMRFDDEMIRLSEFLITCCNVKLEEFQPAIDWFEEIIQDPPSTVDSVFAVIDAGYTYLLIENSRALCVGEIPELKPESRKQHKEKRDELINMLFGNSEPENEIPPIYKLALYSNYPNPFNPSTTIEFSLPKESNVELSVYNIRGQKVKTLVKDEFESGKHSVIWFGKDNNNKKCSSGIYFYQLKVNGKSKSVKKCLLLK